MYIYIIFFIIHLSRLCTERTVATLTEKKNGAKHNGLGRSSWNVLLFFVSFYDLSAFAQSFKTSVAIKREETEKNDEMAKKWFYVMFCSFLFLVYDFLSAFFQYFETYVDIKRGEK